MKKRLDIVLVERGLFSSREKAQSAILAGWVWSKEVRLDKAGTPVADDIPIEVRSTETPFVGRGGLKLAHALDNFQISVKDRVCLDVGSSTGGFTDCLLQRGARLVFSIDVGKGQLDFRLRNHPRVRVLEETNARHLTQATLLTADPLGTEASFACFDLSFISLAKVVEPLVKEFPNLQTWVFLFKPQFEVGPQNLKKGGVVKSPEATQNALSDFQRLTKDLGLRLQNPPTLSPVLGKKSGNEEWLLHYER